MLSEEQKKRIIRSKFNLHKISFDDDEGSQRSDAPNIFLNNNEAQEEQKYNYKKPRQRIVKKKPVKVEENYPIDQSLQEIGIGSHKKIQYHQRKQSNQSTIQRKQPIKEIDLVDDDQIINQEEDKQIDPNTSLSIMQIIKLRLGEFLFKNYYPIKKMIYIDNNNQRQNEINKAEHKNKHHQDLEIESLYYSNTIEISNLIYVFTIIFRSLFTYLHIYLWLLVTILGYVSEFILFKDYSLQYIMDKNVLLALVLVALAIGLTSEFLSSWKRRNFEENDDTFRVYHHTGSVAEWINTSALDLKPGFIIKVPPSQTFPTDCLLLHSKSSLLHIKQNHIISQLTEHPSDSILKEILIKEQEIILPLSGCFIFEINSAEMSSSFKIGGKLDLEQPQEKKYQVDSNNIAYRGSVNNEDQEILVMVLETGIDSMMMKHVQYPFQHRRIEQQFIHDQRSKKYNQKKRKSQKETQVIQRSQTLIGANLEPLIHKITNIFLIIYIILVGFCLMCYIFYNISSQKKFYMSQQSISIVKLSIYYALNFIIFIPIMMIPIYKLFIALEGFIIQWRLKKRGITYSKNDMNKTKNRLLPRNQAESEESQQEVAVGGSKLKSVMIKDHYLVPELADTDILITTIDTFRVQSCFTLHLIRVKELIHNFTSNSLEDEVYSISDVQLLKYFMDVALLTTNINKKNTMYDKAISTASKRYFDIQLNINKGEISTSDNQFKVRHMFTIQATEEEPYKIIFIEPITQNQAQRVVVQDSYLKRTNTHKKILVLIKGNTDTILSKVYGKETRLSQEARKYHEEKGYYVEILGKTTLFIDDVLEIQRAYKNTKMNKKLFFKNLERYIAKFEPMGLLVFANQFYQNTQIRNPILNNSIIMNHYEQSNKQQLFLNKQVINSKNLPKTIIIASPSKSPHPEFEAIHTITNLLINPYLFNYTLPEVASKIMHQKPQTEVIMQNLEEEKVVVWNGWENREIQAAVDELKKEGKKVVCYLEKDDYLFLSKQADCSFKGNPKKGYDVDKYADIILSTSGPTSLLYITNLINYDSPLVRQGILNIILTQVSKSIFYIMVEIINIFYTRSTAINVIFPTIFLLIEILLVLDVLFYISWGDNVRVEIKRNDKMKQNTLTSLLAKHIFQTLLQSIAIIFITIYALQTPYEQSGGTQSYIFTNFTLTFIIFHILILQKFLSPISKSISVYKLLIVLGQIILFYIGLVGISIADTYYYKSVLWSMKGNIIVVQIGCIWMCLSVPFVRVVWGLIKDVSKERIKSS